METTLGKRIALNRKRLGLTQDKLAERLGVTAQAVSKWENDLSCPDITLLPKLAQVFGITTDELLGVVSEEKPVKPVLEGTVESSHAAQEEPDFEFNWKAGKRDGLLYGIYKFIHGITPLFLPGLNPALPPWQWSAVLLQQ